MALDTQAFPIEMVAGVTVDMAMVFHAAAAAILAALAMAAIVFRLRKVPGKNQSVSEMLVAGLSWMIDRAAGPRAARRFLALIGSALLFVFGFHVLGVLRLDALSFGAFPHPGLDVGGETLLADLDGDGLHDPGDKLDPADRNKHLDRGLFIPNPSLSAHKLEVDILVAIFLAAVIVIEAVRCGRLIRFVSGVLTFRWLVILYDVFRGVCVRRGFSRFRAGGLLLILAGLSVLGGEHLTALARFGLDVPLSFVDAVARTSILLLVALGLLGCATGASRGPQTPYSTIY